VIIMAQMTRGPRRADRLLLVEAALALVVFALFVYLFLVPAARPPFAPRWWTALALAAAFFSLIALDAWRRKRGREQDRQRAGRSRSGPPRPDEPALP
jgi:peptidoglycan/LPS O-acetylase OafA/YrhL